MSKQKTPDFQTIQQHIAEIMKVRSDITIHSKTEALLSKLMATIDLQDHEFEQVFTSALPEIDEGKKKKKKRKKSKPHALKAITGAQLALLLNRARVDEFQESVRAEASYQQEIQQFQKAHPDVAKLHFDFTRKLSPESAIDFLDSISHSNDTSKERLEELLSQHEKDVDSFLDEYGKLMEKFSEQLKEQGLAVSLTDLKHAFRLLSETTDE